MLTMELLLPNRDFAGKKKVKYRTFVEITAIKEWFTNYPEIT